MKSIAVARQVKVSADGRGVVSHPGMELLRELADVAGLSAQVTAVLADTYKGPWAYAPDEVFADLAAAVADRCISVTSDAHAGLVAAIGATLPGRPERVKLFV